MKTLLRAIVLILLMQGYVFGAQVSEIVTTTAPQTLLNKIIQSPTLSGTTIADPASSVRLGAAAHTAPTSVSAGLPATCAVGDMHFRTDAIAGQNIYICPTLNTWFQISGGGGGGSGDLASNTNVSVDNELMLFSGITGKLAKRATGTGLLKMSNGVLSSYSLAVGSSKLSISNASGAGGTPTLDLVEANVTIGNLGGNLPASKLPAHTGDVTSSAGSAALSLANIPNATPVAGHLSATAIAAPGTPASGKGNAYVDSTQKVWSMKDDTGVVTVTVKPITCSGQFISAIAANGVPTCSTPAGAGDVTSNTATSVANEIALFADTTGKLLKRATLTGILKAAAGVVSAAVSGTDYAPATSGSAILKGNGSGGFSNASQGVDYYAPGGTPVAIVDGGSGAITAAGARTNYGLVIGTNVAPATPAGTPILKSNNAGGFSSAVSATDYAPATSGSSVLKASSGGFAAATANDIGGPFSCTSAIGTDAYACNTSPVFAAYASNVYYFFKADVANVGGATIQFNGITGPKTIKKVVGGVTTDLIDNDIRAGQIVMVAYDGTNMQMLSQLGNSPTGISGLTPGKYSKSVTSSTIGDGQISDDGTNIFFSLPPVFGASCGSNCLTLDPSLVTGLKTQQYQNIADVFVYRTSTDTLQNKSMSGAANTFTNLPVASVVAALKTKQIAFVIKTGATLVDADDLPAVYTNKLAAMHITSVFCKSVGGSPIINLQRDDGSPANILSSNLTCTTGGATSSAFTSGEDALALNNGIDFVMVTGAGTQVSIVITATLD